ncbi:MAG: YqgE/AlgH family protein [Proteobacteria bacterium]|nr:YqgE/AlgH family protein [Pseudomonadota bacterium]
MNFKNHFLIAMPGLAGDYFANTLTYICEHSEEGAMGLVINRPSDVSILELLAQLNLQADKQWLDTPVLLGGPVSRERGFVLHGPYANANDSEQITSEIFLSSALQILGDIAEGQGPEHVVIALGYAGWQAGQLEDEITRNVWLTTEATTDILFTADFESRLDQAAALLGVDMRLLLAGAGHG